MIGERMTRLKLIVAIMVAIFAIGYEVEADQSVRDICDKLKREMRRKLSPEDATDAKKTMEFANNLMTHSEIALPSDNAAVTKLSSSWAKVINRSKCVKSSLDIVATIAECEPETSKSMKTLADAIEVYAQNCLKPDYVSTKIKSATRNGPCFLGKCFKSDHVNDFIDDQFIADYKSTNPDDDPKKLELIKALKSEKAVAKAVARDLKGKVKELKNERDLAKYLNQRLFEPCQKYVDDFHLLLAKIVPASEYLQGGYKELISSLDKGAHKELFRYTLCWDLGEQQSEIPGEVFAYLRQLADHFN